ncbi:hypothetical protein LTR91_025938 [Friedmanniomyces endolithicus]|uniref:DUF202 domain-containing protein n=2 Tax=Dothideomycetidae TaxID=451867 RepID=A0AAN6JW72_9PEZI|nr:hypothetical protein LTR94_005241 [Friedmanniomyces endolithicus]KAK5145428.1 hypothetical protein LTR32_002803 [Rachicladosporium monterosium]KAK0804422.1 hypothetical protein LTR38_005835 [Friedmanniomyces endolithicus]KAK0841472.1 hypothetical protein LTR03_009873 [Friedmanniomyces endolithicus]KAK0877672.1 hypothetical protein LTR87_008457 [Friedmanniomyces endolithicus]
MPKAPSKSASNADLEFWHEPYNPIYNLVKAKPVLVHQRNDYDRHVFIERPYLGPLLFDNNDSDARDHCAAERTFLSWLRLATYMSIVAVAILISFHLKHQPSEIERRVALPFGLVFWFLALACLISGFSNYIKTVNKYSRRQALVQTGTGTQIVFTVVAAAIIAACVLFLSTNAGTK